MEMLKRRHNVFFLENFICGASSHYGLTMIHWCRTQEEDHFPIEAQTLLLGMYHLDLKGLCSHIYLLWDNTRGGEAKTDG